MMEIVTVWLLYTVTILIKYRHYFVEENLLVKYPSVSLSFMIEIPSLFLSDSVTIL